MFLIRKRIVLLHLNGKVIRTTAAPPGFVAGTPILTPENHKPIEDLKPGDLIQTQQGDDQADNKQVVHEEPHW